MNETTETVDVDAPPARVWAVLEDVRRMPELSPSTESVDAPARLRAVGDTFDQTLAKGFVELWGLPSKIAAKRDQRLEK